MTTTWADDFPAPDGPIGNGWMDASGKVVKAASLAHTNDGSETSIYRDLGAPCEYQDVTVTIPAGWGSDFSNWTYIYLRNDQGGTWYEYRVRMVQGANNCNVSIYRVTPWWNYTPIDSQQITLPAGGVTIRAKSDVDSHQLYVNGSLVASGVEASIASGRYAGLNVRGAAARETDLFEITYGAAAPPAATLRVAPDRHWGLGAVDYFTLFGTLTSWAPGIPGTPIFTVDAGTVDWQMVIGPTLAIVRLTCPMVEGVVTVTDPASGATGTYYNYDESLVEAIWHELSQKLGEVNALVAMILGENTGADPELQGINAILRRLGNVPLDEDIWSTLVLLWNQWQTYLAAWGIPDPLPESLYIKLNSARSDALAAKNLLTNLTSDGWPTLHILADAIRGVSDRTITDVYTQLAPDPTTVHDHVSATDNSLSTMRTASLWTLGNVKTWIEAIPAATSALVQTALNTLVGVPTTTLRAIHDRVNDVYNFLSDVHTDLAAAITSVKGADGRSITDVYNDADVHYTDLHGHLAHVDTDLTELRGPSHQTLQTVLDAIDDVQDAADRTYQPIAWPGAALVVEGLPIAWVGDTHIHALMQGCKLEITTVAAGTSEIHCSDVVQYRYLGWYAFEGPAGYLETPRYLTFKKQLLSPLHIVSATGLVIHCFRQASGSITPWNLAPPF